MNYYRAMLEDITGLNSIAQYNFMIFVNINQNFKRQNAGQDIPSQWMRSKAVYLKD